MLKNKNKLLGFSMVELLITIGIMGILAVMSVPSMSRNMRENAYNEDVEKIWSMLNEARVNALASKRCGTSGGVGTWRFKMEAGNTTTKDQAKLSCKPDPCSNSGTSCDFTEVEIYPDSTNTNTNPKTEINTPYVNGTLDYSKTDNTITFHPKTARADVGVGDDFFLIIGDYGLEKCNSIKLNRIAGFPTRKRHENIDSAGNCPLDNQ